MELRGITWEGPEIEDAEILAELPEDLRGVLDTINGFIRAGQGARGEEGVVAPVLDSCATLVLSCASIRVGSTEGSSIGGSSSSGSLTRYEPVNGAQGFLNARREAGGHL